MIKDALQDIKTCPNCQGIGRVVKNGQLLEPQKNISDLTIDEFKNVMVDCFEMLEQRKLDTSMKEYDKLTQRSFIYNKQDLNPLF